MQCVDLCLGAADGAHWPDEQLIQLNASFCKKEKYIKSYMILFKEQNTINFYHILGNIDKCQNIVHRVGFVSISTYLSVGLIFGKINI